MRDLMGSSRNAPFFSPVEIGATELAHIGAYLGFCDARDAHLDKNIRLDGQLRRGLVMLLQGLRDPIDDEVHDGKGIFRAEPTYGGKGIFRA